ncbi:MAG: metallophosphoesterase [bacterium]|jgi:putative phosphoesterase
MKIGIISDSHDHLTYVKQAVDIMNERMIDSVLHAGDYVAPFVINEFARLKAPLHGIYGNNDGERVGLSIKFKQIGSIQVQPLFIELAGKQIAMVHEPELVASLASSGRYNLIIYGHTHQLETTKGNPLIINPGELCGWLTGKATCVILDLDTMEPEVITL